MFWDFPLEIQCLDTETNSRYKKTFSTQEDLITYIQEQFKTPGEYNLVNTDKWQETGGIYTVSQKATKKPNFEGGYYVKTIKGTHQWKTFWASEKDKVKNGCIIDGWYIPGFYYWYLNYCPIYNDVAKKKMFGYVWDSDFWFFQYIMLCFLTGKHAVVVKARQRGYSFKIMSLLYWSYSWFEGSVNTIGAYKEEYTLKSWRFMEFYRKHLNSPWCAWRRGPVRPKSLEWYERTETQDGGYTGLDSKLSATTFKTDPENGVGGSQTIFFYEEAGIAPTLLHTVGFVRPALEKGNKTTGLIIASGAVGDLDDCQNLKEIFYSPNAHNFLGVKNIWDKKPVKELCGLFVSEAYNLEGFTDKWGNSLTKDATKFIMDAQAAVKANKKKDLAQLDISQKPLSPEAAFDQRKSSEWPTELMATHQQRIDLATEKGSLSYKPQKGILVENAEGVVVLKTDDVPPEHEYPIKPDWADKRGVTTIYEPPSSSKPEFKLYFGGLDPVEAEITTTSESVQSLYIFKAPHIVEYKDDKGVVRTRIEGDKVVASYIGRYDNPEKTNEQCWLLIKMYNAFTLVERNKPNFINYMQRNGRAEMYLAKEKDFPMFKDLPIDIQLKEGGKFGFYKGKLKTTEEKDNSAWKYMKDIGKEYFSMQYWTDTFTNTAGVEETLKIYRGIDRIPDRWLLEEFIKDNGKVNVDRIISFLAALFLCKITFQTLPMKKVSEVSADKPKPKLKVRSRPDSFLHKTNSNQTKRYTQKSFLKTL